MRSTVRKSTCFVRSLPCLAVLILAPGCGGRGDSKITVLPIAVSLAVSTVVVPQDGTQVIVSILITSTSETALVSVRGLPAGVEVKYNASDTNPSGSLAFTGSATTPQGTYSATVTVNSAGQTASTNFTLVIIQSDSVSPEQKQFRAKKLCHTQGEWQRGGLPNKSEG